MRSAQALYLNRAARGCKLESPDSDGDFLARYSEEHLLARFKDAYLANESTKTSQAPASPGRALILGARSNQLYASLNQHFESVDQYTVQDVAAALDNGFGYEQQQKQGQFDLVLCPHLIDWFDPNLLLPMAIDLLKPGGELLLSFFGDQCAQDLAFALHEIDPKPHFQALYAMADVGDHLAGSGLQRVVVDAEHLALEYTSVAKLLDDARRVEGANFNPERRQGLSPKGAHKKIIQYLEAQLASSGTLTVDLELCYARGAKKDGGGLKVAPPSFTGA